MTQHALLPSFGIFPAPDLKQIDVCRSSGLRDTGSVDKKRAGSPLPRLASVNRQACLLAADETYLSSGSAFDAPSLACLASTDQRQRPQRRLA